MVFSVESAFTPDWLPSGGGFDGPRFEALWQALARPAEHATSF